MARAGVSGNDLAASLGWSRSSLQRRLDGSVEFTVSELQRVASLLGCPLSALIPDEVAA